MRPPSTLPPSCAPSWSKREALLNNTNVLEALDYANVGVEGHPVVSKGAGKTAYQLRLRSRNIMRRPEKAGGRCDKKAANWSPGNGSPGWLWPLGRGHSEGLVYELRGRWL